MARLQSAMAVVEGYSEHVMDALGERLIPDHESCARPWTAAAQPLGAASGWSSACSGST